MSKKNKKNQTPELELSYPYASVTHRYSGGMWVSIRYESGVDREKTSVETTAEAHYFAAKHGCKVWLDGDKVKKISGVALAKVQEEETEAGRKAKEEEDAINAKIASMKDRPLTEEEIQELPKLFWGCEWLGRIGLGIGVLFVRSLANGNCLVFAENGYDGVRLVEPYERSKQIHFDGGRDPLRSSRLTDGGHF